MQKWAPWAIDAVEEGLALDALAHEPALHVGDRHDDACRSGRRGPSPRARRGGGASPWRRGRSVSLMVGLRSCGECDGRAGRSSRPALGSSWRMRSGGAGSADLLGRVLELALELGQLGARRPSTCGPLKSRCAPSRSSRRAGRTTIPTMNGQEMLPEVGKQNRTIRTRTQKIATQAIGFDQRPRLQTRPRSTPRSSRRGRCTMP